MEKNESPEKNPAIDALKRENSSISDTDMDVFESSPKDNSHRAKEILQILRKQLPRLIKERSSTIDKNAKYARLCILDAFQGRLSNGLATNSKKSKLMFTIFSIQTSDFFLKLVVFSCYLHTLSVFVEPVKGCSASPFMFMFHLAVSLIHVSDVILKMTYEGAAVYWSHDWQRLYLLTVAANFIDLCLHGCTTYTNPLRPVVGLLRARSGRRFFTIVQKMIPGLSQSLLPMFVFLVILITICGIFFDDKLPQLKDAKFASYNWFWMIYTNDTYNTLLPPELYNDFLYMAFFFFSIYLGQKFLLSLILGATFDTFRAFTKKQLKDERNKEIQGLVKAFAAVDDIKAGIITEPVFRSVLLHFQPGLSMEEKSLYYELISNGNNSGVTILQFLNLHDVLSYKFTRVRDHYSMKLTEDFQKFVERIGTKIIIPVPVELIPYCINILKTFKSAKIRLYVNYCDIFLLCIGQLDWSPFPTTSLIPPIPLCLMISIFYILEFLMTLIAHKGCLWDIVLKQDLFSYEFVGGTWGAIMSYILPAALPSLGINVDDAMTVILLVKFQLLSRFLRCMRIARMSKDLSTFISAMIDVMPLFVQSMGFAFVVSYIFAMGGNLLFGNYIERWATPVGSMVAMQQLFLPFNFLEVMEEVMSAGYPLLAIIYFTTYFILSLIICNLSLSIIIEWYSDNLNDKSKVARKSREASDNQLFQNIINRAMGRKVMSGNSERMFFKDIRFTKHTTNDHRVKLVGSDTVDLDDLKKCQKYSNIDLVKIYNEVHRHHKDMNMEVEFIRNSRESGACTIKTYKAGETLFKKGEDAENCYLITSGVVTIMPSDNSLSISVHAISAIGSESMQPRGKYSYTCMAEGDLECLQFSQDNITMDLEPALAGTLMRIVFKSQAHHEELWKERSRILRRKTTSIHSRKNSSSISDYLNNHNNTLILQSPSTDTAGG